MSPFDYKYLRGLLKERSGLVLGDDKEYLVEARLMPVARRAGVGSIAELVRRLRASEGKALIVDVVEAMMINESFFFRDRLPFDRLRDTVLPALIAARAESRRLRIWSAASSTGQEPYSLAMLLKEFAPSLSGWTVEIVASDISNEVTEKARTGLYTQFEVQRGLPIHLLMTHFERSDERWRIAADLREMVRFKQQNLLDDFSALGRFDVVFLRNVLIYFDQATKADVLQRVANVLVPDGYLLLGAAETVVGVSDHFQTIADRQGLYMPKRNGRPAPRLRAIEGGLRSQPAA
ncbi:MAG TPA: CheR family methyltransferase [Xanthobacteraceae bacterium]|nr:CheR family methyltransferase [Xanthobacteraceae bacterium]